MAAFIFARYRYQNGLGNVVISHLDDVAGLDFIIGRLLQWERQGLGGPGTGAADVYIGAFRFGRRECEQVAKGGFFAGKLKATGVDYIALDNEGVAAWPDENDVAVAKLCYGQGAFFEKVIEIDHRDGLAAP